MSEHYFAATTEPVSAQVSERRDRIAREVGGPGCGYTTISPPEGGQRSWGVCPNRGEPFDRATAREIMAAWAEAGVGA